MLPPVINVIILLAKAEYFVWKGEKDLIEVTKLNDKKILINADLIERVEESPDAMITLTSGSKIIVKESRQEIRKLVIRYKKEILSKEL